MNEPKEKTGDALTVSFLVLCVLMLFFKVSIFSQGLYGSDFVSYFYPLKKFIREYFLTYGNLPFWNPYLFSGAPLIANIQASMFYPLGFLYYLIPPELAYGYSTVLHCVLGSVFMYAFMRTLAISPSGSFLSAGIFTFNGYFMGHLYAGHLTFVQNYIWIPLIFLFLYRFMKTGRFKFAVLGGLFLGIQILGGFPQIAFYTILGLLLFGLLYNFCFLQRHRFNDAWRLSLGLVAIVFLGFSLAAIQILPTVEFSKLSTRAGGVDYAFATYESLHPKEILAFIMPDFFGNAVDGTYWRSSEIWHFWESCGYVGILPLFMVFIRTKNTSLGRLRILFILLIVLSLFLALGKYNPLYPLVYNLPGFDRFRIPAQIIFLYIFGVAVLSGIGLHQIQKADWRFNRGFLPFFFFLGVILLFFMAGLTFFRYQLFLNLFKYFAEEALHQANFAKLYERFSFSIYKSTLLFFGVSFVIWIWKRGMVRQRIFNIIILSILIVDLFSFGTQFIKPHQFDASSEKKRLISKLPTNPAQGRVITIGANFQTNDGLQYRFPSILGYDPLILRRYVYYIQSSQNDRLDNHVVNLRWAKKPNSKLIQMLNTRLVASDGTIIDLDNELPYVNIVNHAVIKPHNEILPFMKSHEFDPRMMVVLDSRYRDKLLDARTEEALETSWSLIEYDIEKIHFKAYTNKPAYLLLSEIAYPGWRAKVDGKKVEMLCGNYLFRVIPLDKGEHEVFLYFISWPFRIGALISLLTLVGSLWFISRREGRNGFEANLGLS